MNVKIIFDSEMWEIYPIESESPLDVLDSATSYDEITDICDENGYNIVATIGMDDDDD